MNDKKILMLVGAVGGTNLLATILTAVMVTSGVAGPAGSQGLPGSNGQPGSSGQTGNNGQSPYIGNNGNWWIGSSDTGVSAGGLAANEDENFIVNQYDLLTDSITVSELKPLSMLTEWETYIPTNLNFTPVSTQADLEAMVTGGDYILTNNITLTTPWVPLNYEGDAFSIYLDGNDKTISGLVINGDLVSQSPVGFFSQLADSIIFDLTFDAPVVNKPQVAAKAGVLAGQIENTWIKNVTIQGCEVNGVKELGVLAGVIANSEIHSVSLINNTLSAISYAGALAYKVYDTLIDDVLVSNLTFEPDFAAAYAIGLFDFQGDVGGLIGYAGENVQLDKIIVENSTLDFINGSFLNGYRYEVQRIGGVIGRANGNANYDFNFLRLRNILMNNTTIMGLKIGGIVGELQDVSLIITDSEVTNSDLYAGILESDLDVVDLLNLTETNYNYLRSYVGGFFGEINSSGVVIVDTYVNATLTGQSDVGGYIGYYSGNDDTHEFLYFKNSTSDSDIFVKDRQGGGFGGYLGNIEYIIFENSANLSDIQSFYNDSYADSIGGFSGEFYEINAFVLMSNSFNSGDVVGDNSVGGIVGYNEVEGFDNDGLANGGLILYNVYNTGDVYGSSNVGGFVGEQYDQDNIMEIHNSLQAGQLFNTDGTTPDYTNNEHGAFVGENNSSNSVIRNFNSFYLEQTDVNDFMISAIADDFSSYLNQGEGGVPFSGLPTTGFINLLTSGSIGQSGGSVVNVDAFTDQDNFYYEGIWNFEEAWTFEFTIDGFPTLIHSYRPS